MPRVHEPIRQFLLTARKRARHLVDHAIGLVLAAVAAVTVTGGFTAGWAGRTVSVHGTRAAALAVLVLLLLRWLPDRDSALSEIPAVAGLARLAVRWRAGCRKRSGALLTGAIVAYVAGGRLSAAARATESAGAPTPWSGEPDAQR